jgi:hypothetical protein
MSPRSTRSFDGSCNVSGGMSAQVPAVYRRAGGRRRYNALRRDLAAFRRLQVADLLNEWGLVRGVQRRIAETLGVSEATISRDVAHLLHSHVACGQCGSVFVEQKWAERAASTARRVALNQYPPPDETPNDLSSEQRVGFDADGWCVYDEPPLRDYADPLADDEAVPPRDVIELPLVTSADAWRV